MYSVQEIFFYVLKIPSSSPDWVTENFRPNEIRQKIIRPKEIRQKIIRPKEIRQKIIRPKEIRQKIIRPNDVRTFCRMAYVLSAERRGSADFFQVAEFQANFTLFKNTLNLASLVKSFSTLGTSTCYMSHD